MKVGKLNKLDDLPVVVSSSETSLSGFSEQNVLDEKTQKKWKVEQGTVTLTLEFSSISAEAICLFNLDIENDVTVKTFNSSLVETNSITINQSVLPGLDIKNGLFELTNQSDIVKVQVVMNGATATFETALGYIWVGDLIDFGELEALVPTDEGTDDLIITRSNNTSKQKKYNFQRFKLTTNKSILFATLVDNVREILSNGGYAQKRPFIIGDCVYSPENLILGTFDSGVFQYDLLLDPDKTYAQTSKGIIEVF